MFADEIRRTWYYMLLSLCRGLILISQPLILVVLGSLLAAACLYNLACPLRTPLLSLAEDVCAYLFIEARVRRFLVRISHLQPLTFHQYYHGEQYQHCYSWMLLPPPHCCLMPFPNHSTPSCHHHRAMYWPRLLICVAVTSNVKKLQLLPHMRLMSHTRCGPLFDPCRRKTQQPRLTQGPLHRL